LTPRKERNFNESRKVWVNFTIQGEPGDIYLALKKRGLIVSTRDAFVQGLRCLHERIVEADLKRAKLVASRRLNRELNGEEF
jgi:hypothetical protein